MKKQTMRAGAPGRSPRCFPTAASARASLVSAINSAHTARGEALWTNGYRTRYSSDRPDDAESSRLYQKELAQLRYCSAAEDRVKRALATYARAIRAEAKRG
jgi:hypothetical protein